MDIQRQALLTRLQEDRHSGASELAVETLRALGHYLAGKDPLTPAELVRLGDQLKAARPSMAALANALTRWQAGLNATQSAPDFRHQYLHELATVELALFQAGERVTYNACSLIVPGAIIMTHSRSSAVLSLFRELVAQSRPFEVIVTLSGPGNEGTLVAEELNRLRVPTTLISDAQTGLFMREATINISGCDSWLADGYFINKSGTYLQALAARDLGKPFWVLADAFKDSRRTSQTVQLEEMAGDELGGPQGTYIRPRNTYFELIPTRLVTGRVDERGQNSVLARE